MAKIYMVAEYVPHAGVHGGGCYIVEADDGDMQRQALLGGDRLVAEYATREEADDVVARDDESRRGRKPYQDPYRNW